MKKEKFTLWRDIKLKKSEIKICKCGRRFIEIDADIRKGIKRVKCPECKPYKHWKRKDSANLHRWTTENILDL